MHLNLKPYLILLLLIVLSSCEEEEVKEATNEAPTISDQQFSIEENSENGTVVGSVLFADPEDDEVTLEIVDGNTNNTFSLSTTDGQLTVNNNELLDYETNETFELEIEANDGENVSNAFITITLIDVDEIVPTIDGCIVVGLNQSGEDYEQDVSIEYEDGKFVKMTFRYDGSPADDTVFELFYEGDLVVKTIQSDYFEGEVDDQYMNIIEYDEDNRPVFKTSYDTETGESVFIDRVVYQYEEDKLTRIFIQDTIENDYVNEYLTELHWTGTNVTSANFYEFDEDQNPIALEESSYTYYTDKTPYELEGINYLGYPEPYVFSENLIKTVEGEYSESYTYEFGAHGYASKEIREVGSGNTYTTLFEFECE